ncbi:MAG: hypothetical protein JWM65_1955 [Sphingomonas bacterium]|nr:hypothetical protein [Sphingomonas bacterium]
MARLMGELALSEGEVPDRLDAPLAATPVHQIGADAFLLSLPMGLAFHYRRGAGTVFRRWPGVGDDAVTLFFEGAVLGAIAWLNGFVPLRASAVLHGGKVHGFAGSAGAGKSTLAAALARRGMALCADEVLILDPDDPTRIVIFPAMDRAKLWGDALALAGCIAGPAVRPGIDKFHVPDVPVAPRTPLPFHRLYFLENGTQGMPGIAAIPPSDMLERLASAWYRPQFFYPLVGPDHAFETATRLARAIPMARFHRSLTPATFSAAVNMVAAHISADG